jgi:hypothetical protein
MSKYPIDITGQKFGRLTAIEYVESGVHGAIWKFQCDCGNVKNLAASEVKRGNAQSCGCIHKGRPIADISGQTFGRMTAIEFVGIGKRNQAWWKFRCECGAVKELKASDVKSGRTESCGCVMYRDISGSRFGRLVAIKRIGKGRDGRTQWECACDCGSTASVSTSNLINGTTKSCGCYMRDRVSEVNTTHGLSGTKEHYRAKAHRYRERHGGHEPTWNSSMEKALSDFFPSCVICGSDKHLQTDHVFPKSKGYILKPGNAVKLCRAHNGSGFKGGKSPDELPEEAREKILTAASRFEEYWSAVNGL